ncbi:DUF3519 domain-containing protein, partial [Campylobacter felis]|uniref:putative barnase/colicin E5 family endoribonuclease n=1 Tax=Campylobacter felis TaxID=2974565 RepID=UPI002564ADFF
DDYFEKMQELKDIENKFYKYITGLEKTKNQIENIQFQIQKANLEKINELNERVDESVKNLIDKSTSKGRDMQIIGAANFTPQIAKYIHENKKRIAIEKLDAKEAENLGFKFPNEARATIDYTAIQHTLKRHGGDSKLAKESGQEPINYDDIANYRNIAKNADETLQSEDKSGNKVVVSFKQINGHFVVVEQMQRKNNDLAFKTMFKEKGEYKNSPSYKETRAKTQTLSSGYEPSANSFVKPDESIPQKPQEIIEQAKEQGKSVTETKEYETLKEHIWIPLQKEIQQAEQELIEVEKRNGELLDDDFKQSYIETTIRNFYRDYEIPKEVKAIQKKYFNQAMPQEYEKFLNSIKNLPEQTVANDLREAGSEANVLQYFKDFVHNNYVGKSMAKRTQTAKEAEFLFLRLKYNKDFDIPNEAFDLTSAKGKAAFGKFKTSLKKGELTDKVAFYLYDQNIYKVRKSIERLLNITPLKEFGTNYAEFYRDGKGAVKKLIREAQAFKESGEKGEFKAQVSGAFYKEGLGDIDLVWGEVKGSGREAKGYGLSKIIEKHGEDLEGVSKGLDEIITKGEIHTQEYGRKTIIYHKNGDVYKVGLKQNWKGEPTKNSWVITSYKEDREVDKFIHSSDFTKGETLPLNSNEIIAEKYLIDTLKEMQDREVNVKLGDEDLLDLYEKSSREIYDVLAKKLHLDSVKQYRSDGYALFENSSLGADAKASFEAILRKNLRQRQLENFEKPQNVKYEIQTEQGFKYYLDENNDVVINHKNELVDFKGGVVRTKPDKDGDILELNGVLRLISPRNADNMYLAKRDLTNNEFYDFHANLRLANYYQNGLFVSDEKLYEVFKNMPRSADKQGLDDVMGILRGLTKSKNVNLAYAQEFIDKHYGLEADYRTLARDIFKRVDKEYKKNGNPFGILFNDEKAIKDIREVYGDEIARDFFKGENAVDFLLYTQAGHIENAFYKEGLGDIDVVWGDENFGLKHILEQRAKQWGEEKALKFISHLSENIEKGQIVELEKGRVGIKTDLTTIILDKKENNNFVLTAFRDRNNKKELESLNLSQSKTFTNENAGTNAKESPITPLNQESTASRRTDLPSSQSEAEKTTSANATDEIIPQKSINLAMEKSSFDEKKALNSKSPILKEKFERAKNYEEKIELITREFLKENERLKEQIAEIKNIIENKDYTENELLEAMDLINEAKSSGEKLALKKNGWYIPIYQDDGESIESLAQKIIRIEKEKFEIKPLMDRVKRNQKRIQTMKWDYKQIKRYPQDHKYYKGHKQRLDKNIDSFIKKLLRDESDHLRSLSLNYNLNTESGLKKVRDLFYKSFKPNEEQIAIFEAILPVAKELNVWVRGALRDPYESFYSDNTIGVAGWYIYGDNSARVKHSLKKQDKGKTLLHELIHSVTSRAMYVYEKGDFELLTKRQIEAIKNIKNIYEQIKEQRREFGFIGDYGLKNSHEMLAELSNPKFVEKLKKVNVFEKLIDNILKLFISAKEFLGLKKTNAYDKLKENLSEIIQNYKTDFSEQFQRQKYRNMTDETKTNSYNLSSLRNEVKEHLSAIIGKNIINENDGRIASISRKNISKMTSDKAIQKSVNNGFTPQDHFKAVQDIESLYQGAVLKETHADRKSNNPNVFIHRYTADFNGNNALITIKESLDSNSKGNKIYTLELETLELKPSAPEPQGSATMSKNTGYAEPVTPNETHKSIIAEKNAKFAMQKLNEKSPNIYYSNPHIGAGLVGGVLNGVEQDEEGNLSFDPAKFAAGFLGASLG